ncbi:MAG TPA: glutathione S-transferase family protein [Bdellovibrio sp.]|uniref:glutathione S-transferase family protein n=1 Tax=Bdellovibrio sp. TaxID=28201 RepID=UPI002F1BAA9F
MIDLHQYPAVWGLSSLSPFCIKLEIFMKRNNLPYRIVNERNPARGPKGKMPFIRHFSRDGEKIVADSTLIINYLTDVYGLHCKLDPVLQAQGLAFQRMIEEHLYFVLLYSRWVDPKGWAVIKKEFSPFFPLFLGRLILSVIRRQLTKQAIAQGLGRHSEKEVYEIGRRDLQALSLFLGDKAYLLGNEWSPIDATLYAFMTTILKAPIESDLKKSLNEFPNLVAYCERQDSELS